MSRKDDGTLLLEGTPDVSPGLRAELDRYTNQRSAGLADISDDGKRLLVSTRFGETSQIHLVNKPLGARTQITFRREPVRAATFVPGSKSAILYAADRGGDEKHQLYRFDMRSGRTTMITDGKSINASALWSWSGKKVAYRSNARTGRAFDIYVSDGTSAASAEQVAEAKGYWYPAAWSRDDKKLIVGEYIAVTHQRLYTVDVATKKVELLTPEDSIAAYDSPVFSKNGKTLYVLSDREGEFVELYETDITGTKWTSLTRSIPWNVESTALSPDGRWLAFTTNEDGLSVLRLLDTRTRRIKKVPGIPKGLIGGLGFARKANVLGLSMSSATRTGDAYTYDLRTKKLTRWTESELGGLNPATLVEPTLVKYKTFDGAQIPAFYYKPKGAGPFPVVVYIHGGPEGQARPWFSAMSQFLVTERKVAVIYPNVRGSTGYGKTYTKLDNGFKREDSVKDIGALLDWIGAQPELDAKRVGVFGGSYGGYMVLASLVHYSDRIVAGVDNVGISNFVTFLENTGAYRQDVRRAEYGDERDPKMRAHLQKISPLTNVDKINSALFVAQGANDPRVPASEARQIVKAVRAKGKSVWFMLARNEGHGFRKKNNYDTYLALAVLFFDTHLSK